MGGTPGAKREWTERGMNEDIADGLEVVALPTVVVVGDRDQVEHEAALREMFGRYLPQTRFRVLAGAGHLSPLERSTEVASACVEMLDALRA